MIELPNFASYENDNDNGTYLIMLLPYVYMLEVVYVLAESCMCTC